MVPDPYPATTAATGTDRPETPAPPRLRRKPPWRVMVVAFAAAMALHGIVLSGLAPGLDSGQPVEPGPSAVRVRTMAAAETPVPTARTPVSPAMPSQAPAPTPPSQRAPAASPSIPAAPEPTAAEPPLPPMSASEPIAAAVPDVVASAALATTVPAPAPTEPEARPNVAAAQANPAPGPAAPAVALADSGEEIPVYVTSFPPSQRLSFHLRRGHLSGTGVLTWQHDAPRAAGARYELQLDAKVAGLSLLTQRSEGGFDAAGLAPQRFTDQRLRGSMRATNFQRDRGVIGFSGPSVEYPLIPGVQDRLSWMLQLPAIVEAAPQRAAAGERITLYVIGARGDAAVWVFRFVAAELVTTDAGEVPALKFIREPRKPNDTQAEVWLDPTQHHLPVRARLGNPPDGDVLDLVRTAP